MVAVVVVVVTVVVVAIVVVLVVAVLCSGIFCSCSYVVTFITVVFSVHKRKPINSQLTSCSVCSSVFCICDISNYGQWTEAS